MANTSVSNMSAASALSGPELLYCVQSAADTKLTATQVKTWTSSAPTISGHPTIEGVTSTGATGTGNFVFSIAPTITGHPTIEGVTSTGATGSGAFVFATSPTLVTPTVGVATGTSWNGLTITTTTGTFTLTNGKTLSVSNTLTFAGTDSTTMTFPSASASIGYLGTPLNSQSTAYTTVLADSGKTILHPTADNNARTFTIDSNANVAYPTGTVITFINQINTVTIAITSDTLQLAGGSSTGSRTLAAVGMATAVKVASTVWVISGTGLT
jgi:hypothetical protein